MKNSHSPLPHSPLPWRVSKDRGTIHCGPIDDALVVAVTCELEPTTGSEQTEANAQLIMTAVNSHHELVSALRGLLAACPHEGEGNQRAIAALAARAVLAKLDSQAEGKAAK